MQGRVYWVSGPWRGKLGILPRPRGGDWLQDDTSAWRKAGVDVVVSLLEPEEEVQLSLRDEAVTAAASGIDFTSFPIPDRGMPSTRESVAQLTAEMIDALDSGRNVAVHCRQGIGRSGIIVCCTLVASGERLPDVLRAVRDARGLEVPETEEQRRWLADFASWILSTQAAERGRVGLLARD